MELLSVLEKKIYAVVEFAKQAHMNNIALQAECAQLRQRVESLEHTLLSRDQSVEERHRELAETRLVVSELIKNIDDIVEQKLAASTVHAVERS